MKYYFAPREENVSLHLYAFLAACCFLVARKVDNNLQIYKPANLSAADAASSSELEGVIPRGLLFYKLLRGLQHRTVAEYTRDTALSRLCSRDRPSLFTPTPGLARFAERVNFDLQMRRKNNYICSFLQSY